MPYLIDRNIYKDDGRNDALQLRRDLRRLVEKNKLYMLEEAEYMTEGDVHKLSLFLIIVFLGF